MLISKEVELHWSNVIKKYYVDKGYKFTKRGDPFICNVEDLSPSANAVVEVQCDYCGKIHKKPYKDYINGRKTLAKDCCGNCAGKKTEEIFTIKYGDKNYGRKLAHKESMKANDEKRKNTYKKLLESANKKGYILLPFIYQNSNQEIMFLCKKHTDKGIQISRAETLYSSNHNCYFCSCETKRNRQVFDINKVKDIIHNIGDGELISNEYINAGTRNLKITCKLCHKPFMTSLNKYQCGHRVCSDCRKKLSFGSTSPHWKGGISSLNSFLRCSINEWKKDSLIKANYKCDISNKHGYLEVHHLYKNFKDIVSETLELTGLNIRSKISDYTDDELSILSRTCIELHYKYGLGVCMLREYHLDFHSFYGAFNNTPEQYYEFKRYIQEENQQSDSLLLCSNE